MRNHCFAAPLFLQKYQTGNWQGCLFFLKNPEKTRKNNEKRNMFLEKKQINREKIRKTEK